MRTMLKAVPAVLAGALVLGSASAASAVTGDWGTQPTPLPSGATGGALLGVSCPGETNCFGAGNYTTGSGATLPLVEHSEAGTWTAQALTPPGGATFGDLRGISCTSASRCTAVGQDAKTGKNGQPMVAQFRNGAWTLATIAPLSSGRASGRLDAVSCASAGDCTAVGQYTRTGSDAFFALAEHWDGSTWTPETVAVPAGAISSVLSGVSCPATGTCVATGDYNDGSGTEQPLAEGSTAGTWAIQATPLPTGGSSGELNAVSCSGTAACVAVGDYTNSSGADVPLADAWNGSTWAPRTMKVPQGASGAYMTAVSCVAKKNRCTSVGVASRLQGSAALSEYDGGGDLWQVRTTARPLANQFLNGVSCVLYYVCTLDGTTQVAPGQGNPLAEHE